METTVLEFKKTGGLYEAKFTSGGKVTVQLERDERGLVSVCGNMQGMKPVVLGVYDNPYGADAAFSVNIPEGMEVVIRSATEVKKAKLLS